jgi:hypothetical protein
MIMACMLGLGVLIFGTLRLFSFMDVDTLAAMSPAGRAAIKSAAIYWTVTVFLYVALLVGVFLSVAGVRWVFWAVMMVAAVSAAVTVPERYTDWFIWSQAPFHGLWDGIQTLSIELGHVDRALIEQLTTFRRFFHVMAPLGCIAVYVIPSVRAHSAARRAFAEQTKVDRPRIGRFR